MTVARTIEVNDLTPEELAELFCEMDGQEQADFFAAIKRISATWPGAGWCQQSYAINERINAAGRDVIATLAGHVLNNGDDA